MQGIYTKEEGGHRKGIITIKVLGQFMYTSDLEGSILVRRGRTCVGLVCCLLPPGSGTAWRNASRMLRQGCLLTATMQALFTRLEQQCKRTV